MLSSFSCKSFFFFLILFFVVSLFIYFVIFYVKLREEFRVQFKRENPDNKSVAAVSNDISNYRQCSFFFFGKLIFVYFTLFLRIRSAKLVERNGSL